MNAVEKTGMLKEIAEQVAQCKKCILYQSRKNTVPGEGSANAEIMFIGEGPGFYENEQGRPFVGASGRYLSELLLKNGLQRSEVFITNVVKCRPPGNRDPLQDELDACAGYLDRQIEVIDPLVIVTLGRFSMAKYIPNVKISSVHGKTMWIKGRLIIPMYHPAAALHQAKLKSTIEEDFSHLKEFVQTARQTHREQSDEKQNLIRQDETPSTAESHPTQLNLF